MKIYKYQLFIYYTTPKVLFSKHIYQYHTLFLNNKTKKKIDIIGFDHIHNISFLKQKAIKIFENNCTQNYAIPPPKKSRFLLHSRKKNNVQCRNFFT